MAGPTVGTIQGGMRRCCFAIVLLLLLLQHLEAVSPALSNDDNNDQQKFPVIDHQGQQQQQTNQMTTGNNQQTESGSHQQLNSLQPNYAIFTTDHCQHNLTNLDVINDDDDWNASLPLSYMDMLNNNDGQADPYQDSFDHQSLLLSNNFATDERQLQHQIDHTISRINPLIEHHQHHHNNVPIDQPIMMGSDNHHQQQQFDQANRERQKKVFDDFLAQLKIHNMAAKHARLTSGMDGRGQQPHVQTDGSAKQKQISGKIKNFQQKPVADRNKSVLRNRGLWKQFTVENAVKTSGKKPISTGLSQEMIAELRHLQMEQIQREKIQEKNAKGKMPMHSPANMQQLKLIGTKQQKNTNIELSGVHDEKDALLVVLAKTRERIQLLEQKIVHILDVNSRLFVDSAFNDYSVEELLSLNFIRINLELNHLLETSVISKKLAEIELKIDQSKSWEEKKNLLSNALLATLPKHHISITESIRIDEILLGQAQKYIDELEAILAKLE